MPHIIEINILHVTPTSPSSLGIPRLKPLMAAIAIMHLVLCALLTNKLCVCRSAGQQDEAIYIYYGYRKVRVGGPSCGLIEISSITK